MERRDYIVDQIEKIAQFVASLVSKKQAQLKEISINNQLSRLSGIPESLFLEKNIHTLGLMVEQIGDENKRALIVGALKAKNRKLFNDLFNKVMGSLDINGLETRVRTIIKPLID